MAQVDPGAMWALPARDGLRTLAVCCSDFPARVAASRLGGVGVPLAVLSANRVVSLTEPARSEGVSPGQTRREAQARCPSLQVVDPDRAGDTRAFERMMRALEEVAPRWEVGEPGRCAVPVRGPSRFFGGDLAVARRVSDLLEESLEELSGSPDGVGVAVADGPRAAAVLAAIAATGDGPVVVAPGETAARLAGLPVAVLTEGGEGWGDPRALAELVDVLRRMGLRTLGRFAALEAPDVLARFARTGLCAHEFARGAEGSTVVLEELPADLLVSAEIDPPAETVDQVGFVARTLANEMHSALAERGLLCTRVLVGAETSDGERVERCWRDEGTLGATAVAQRVRWQLEGWLQARGEGTVSRLELLPEHLVPDDGQQLELWSKVPGVPRRTREGLARLVAMLGTESVVTPRRRGGRSPVDSHVLEPADPEVAVAQVDDRVDEGAGRGGKGPPWPGSIPAPSPSMVHLVPGPVELCDAAGRPVRVDGRGALSAPPSRCRTGGRDWAGVDAWAGPWCIDERWWDPLRHRRRARMQVLLDSGAHLLTLEGGQWRLEATYD